MRHSKRATNSFRESFERRFVQISRRRRTQRPIFASLCKKKFSWCFYVRGRSKNLAVDAVRDAEIFGDEKNFFALSVQKTLIPCGFPASHVVLTMLAV